MTLLFSCQSLSKSFSTRLLFRDLSLSVFSGDRVGLIGPNGSGKSTLLNIFAGQEKSDSGILSYRKDLRIGYVPQTCDFPDLMPEQILQEALGKDHPDGERLAQMWLSKLKFPDTQLSAQALSGGWKKRLGIAQALISGPDLLLLDEPTNHLDLEGILWLENFLSREAPTSIIVSHDRYFLQHTTNRIIEMDSAYPKGTFAIDGSYSFFLSKKEEFLQGQLQQERSLATKARRETEWLRQGVKARTTKSQARIDDAHELLQEHAAVRKRNQQKRTDLAFSATERETRKLLVAKNLSKEVGDRELFRHLEFTLSPGTRMGLMGPNGSGKTTLLRLLAGESMPDQGTLKRADGLQTVYFDQHRAQLPLNLSLRDALSPKGDYVTFQGREIHVNGWCKRFLFSPDLLDLPIGKLSGGERARISIAHLMLQPADLLLLDEPTNDLDIPTLETLEESLMEFPGAVVLITHDRCMLDRLCNVLIALGDPDKNESYSDFSQWEASLKKAAPAASKPKQERAPSTKQQLSYAEQKEYGGIEKKIKTLEEEIRAHHLQLEQPELAQDPQRLSEICTAVGVAEAKIEQLYLRWEELEKKLKNI